MDTDYITIAETNALISPLRTEVAKLKYKLQRTTNELFKLKDSLVYRDMAAQTNKSHIYGSLSICAAIFHDTR